MVLNIYAMRDAKVGFLQPSFELNDAVALRNFRMAVLNVGSVVNLNKQDFSLWKIGMYDTENGIIDSLDHLVPVFDGKDVVDL